MSGCECKPDAKRERETASKVAALAPTLPCREQDSHRGRFPFEPQVLAAHTETPLDLK